MRLRSNWSQFRLSSTLYIILLFEFAPVSEIHWLKKRKKGTHMRTELISIPTPTHPLDGAYYTPDGPIKGRPCTVTPPDELSMSARRAFLPLMSPRSAMLSSLSIVAGCRRSAEQNQWNEEERQTEERDFFCAAANNYRSRSYEMSSLSFGHSLINLP